MKAIYKPIALVGLLITAAGPVLTFAGAIDNDLNKKLMVTGMFLWFIGAGPWLGSNKLQPSDSQVEI